MKRFELRVRGRVQGVNFRNEAVRKARELGVTGLVWNESDGSVVIVAEGPQTKLDDFLAWARVGPPAAVVKHRKVTWSKPTGQFDDFSIRH